MMGRTNRGPPPRSRDPRPGGVADGLPYEAVDVTSTSARVAAPAGIRRRLITSMLVAVGVAVLLLGVPLASVVRQWVYGQQIAQVRREAEQMVALLDRNLTLDQFGMVVTLSAEALDARVTVLDARARVIRDSNGVPPGTVFDDRPVRLALAGVAGGEVVGNNLVVAAGGTARGAPIVVRLAEPADAVGRVNNALLAILGLGMAALALGAALGSWRARQLAEPLEALAVSARRLGEGDFSERAPRSDIVEIDEIAEALDTTAGRLRTALERSASFSADASHQLRTPLTALRLNLEAIALELDSGSPSVQAAEAEIDRLEATIAELLALADAGAGPDEVDLRALTRARLDAWRTLADAAGRSVRVTREPVPLVRVRPSAVGQALQVLLDNALTHGKGDVTVWLEPVRRGGRVWVRLCVGDEGPGVQPDDLVDGAGRGLPLARSLIESEGGRLVIDADRDNRVCLVLPAVDDPTAGPVDDATS